MITTAFTITFFLIVLILACIKFKYNKFEIKASYIVIGLAPLLIYSSVL